MSSIFASNSYVSLFACIELKQAYLQLLFKRHLKIHFAV